MQQLINRNSTKQPDDTKIESTYLKRNRQILIIASISVMFFAGCITAVSAQTLEKKDLRGFYQQQCARCHGADGSGLSPEGKKLSGLDLTNPEWQRNTKDNKMTKAILKGKFFGWAMPGFKESLTKEEAQRMVTEIIRKSKKGEAISPDSAKIRKK